MIRVLIAPLDWGLGHATRCIPVIDQFVARGCEVLLAGSGDSLHLLTKEFPQLRTFSLPAYAPRYPRRGSMVASIALQLPRFARIIAAEHKTTANILEREHIHVLISDNRYGCWSRKIPSVFITHQRNVLMPTRFQWLQPLVRRLNDRMINRFTRCWIPDHPGDNSLAGDLLRTSESGAGIAQEYIGWLSRCKPLYDVSKKYDVMAVLSGPEPQRTMLEDCLTPQLRNSGLRFRVVRGLPTSRQSQPDQRIINFLPPAALQYETASAHLIIARSGFSTIMDMQAMGKKVVFIPTPGQTEQEYLASRLMEKGIAFSMKQHDFALASALEQSRHFSGFKPAPAGDLLSKAVDRLLAAL